MSVGIDLGNPLLIVAALAALGYSPCNTRLSIRNRGNAVSEELTTDTHPQATAQTQTATVLSSTENKFIRLSFWQTILSVVGLLIAVLALSAALTESAAVRRQTAAAVWPFIQVTVTDFDTGDDAEFMLSFTNSGVGPALVRSVRVAIDGEPMQDWSQAVAKLGGTLNAQVGRNAISNRVLSPGQTVDLITIADADLARNFQAVVQHPDTAITYCYCSIFDECWLANSQSQALDPQQVEMCPDYGDEGFQY